MSMEHNHDGGKPLPFGQLMAPEACPACDARRAELAATSRDVWKTPQQLTPRCYWCQHPAVPPLRGCSWQDCKCDCHSVSGSR